MSPTGLGLCEGLSGEEDSARVAEGYVREETTPELEPDAEPEPNGYMQPHAPQTHMFLLVWSPYGPF